MSDGEQVPAAKFRPGDAVIVYLPAPWQRVPPTGVVLAVAAYAVEGETAYDVLMDGGKHPPVITVRERAIERYGVMAAQGAER